MGFYPLAQTIRRRAVAAGLAAVLVLGASRADASCGDYVLVGGSRVAQHSELDRRDSSAPAIPRCRGPMCSDNSMPPAAPGPKIEITIERWAISAGARLTMLPNHEKVPADSPVIAQDGVGKNVFRPPR